MGSGNRAYRTPDGRPMNGPMYDEYMNQTYYPQQGFNASANAPIPGVTTGYAPGADIPRPGQPAYAMPQAQPLPGGTPMDLSGGTLGPPSGRIGDTALMRERRNSMIGGLLAQLPSNQVPAQPNQMPPSQANQTPLGFGRPGYYGRQAMGMAGLLSPNTPPGDTFPNGLGGKRPFFPGGK